VDELVQTQLTVAVRVDGLERIDGQLGVETEDREEQLELVGLDHPVTVGVDGAEEDGEGAGEGRLELGVVDLGLHRLDEERLGEGLAAGDVLEELLPDLDELSLQLAPPLLIQLLALDESLGHRLEVLLRDRTVLVEVDPREVRLHLARPEVRHLGKFGSK